MSGIIGGAGSKSGVIGTTELDYETGTWTPSWYHLTGTLGATVGRYTKIGNRVFVEVEQAMSSVDAASAANDTNIDGYPFVPAYSTICNACQTNATGTSSGYLSASGIWTPAFSSWDNFRVTAVYITAE